MEEKELDLSAFDETSNDLDLSAFDEPVKKKAPTSGYKPLVEKLSITQKESISPYQDPLLKSKSDSSTLKSTGSSSELNKELSLPQIKGKAASMLNDINERIPVASKKWNDLDRAYTSQQAELQNYQDQLNDPMVNESTKPFLLKSIEDLSAKSKQTLMEVEQAKSEAIKLQQAKQSINKIEKVDSDLKLKKESLGSEMFDAFARGSSSLGASIAKTPAFLYDIAAVPQNVLAEQFPETFGELNASSDKFAENMNLPDNVIADYYDKAAEQSRAKFAQKYDQSITDYISNGDYVNALKSLSLQVSESAPVTLSLMAGNMGGMGAAATTGVGGAVFGAEKKSQLDKENPEMNESAKTLNALSTGLMEGVFETFGITKLGSITKNILASEGKKKAKEFAVNGFKEVYAPILKKYAGVAGEEMTGEMATQFSQNVIDKYSGAKPDLDLMDGVVDAGLVGLGSSGVYSTPVSVLELATTKKNTPDLYHQMKELKVDREKAPIIVSRIEELVKSGKITSEQAESFKSKINAMADADEKIPSNIKDVERRVEAINLIQKKQALEAEIEGKEKSLVTKQEEKIKAIDAELMAIASGRSIVKMERKNLGGKKDVPPAVEKTVADTKVQATEPSVSNDEIEQIKFNKSVGMALTPEEQAKLDAVAPKQPAQQSRPITTNATNSVSKIKALPVEEENGVTLNLDGTEYNEGGVVIPITSENITQEELTPERVQEFVEKHSNKTPEGSSVKLGIYKFPGSNMVSLDLNIVVPKDKAANAVEFAREAGQESVFDLDTMTNQKTGASGESPVQFSDEQFFEIADSLSKGKKPNIVSNKAKEQFISDGIESLKTMEDADYDPANDDVYRKYFSERYDYLNEKGIPKEEVQLREKVLSSTDKVISALSKVAPGIKVITHASKQSFGEALGETDTKQNKLGGGFFDPNTNEIHLNLEEIKSNTLFHEGVHPVLNAIEAANPAAIDKLYNQVVEAEKRAGVEGKYSKEFASRYEESQQKMEAVTEFIADVANGTIEVNESNFDKVKQLFVDLMAAIGIDVSGKIKTVGDLKKLAENISSAFKTGEEITVVEIDPNDVDKAKSGKNPFIQNQLPVRKLKDVLAEYGNKMIAINSDPTKVGKVKFPSGKEVDLFGGVMYVGIKENVQGEVGFAASKMAKVNILNKLAKSTFADTNGVGVVLITAQKPDSILGNYYALDYALDAIKLLPKTIINSKAFRDEFFGKDIKAIKEAFGKKYDDFISKYSKKDFKSDKDVDDMIKELMTDIGNSFEARNALVKNILGGIVAKSARKGSENEAGFVSKTPGKYIAKQLFERFNINQESLFRTLGQEELVDAYFNDGGYGYVAAGFIHDSNVDVNEVQTKGLVHPQFNAKFHGRDAFLTDELYDINKLMPAKTGLDKNGKPFSTSAYTQVAGSMYPKGEVKDAAKASTKKKGIQSQKPDLISKTPKAKYLTEDGEGNYVFYHYSNNDLTKKGIDPNKVGKNIITSRGEKLLAPASFYYTEPNIQEPGTGDYGHVVKVPMDKVYPFNEDPLGLVKIAEERFRKKYPNQAFDANKELAWTSVVAQENGYDMTVANWDGVRGMRNTLRAQSPVKLKPEMWRKPKEGSYGQVEINEELDYKSNRKKKVQKQEPENEITDQELKRAINLLNDKFGGNEVKFTKFLLGTEAGKDLLARGISQAVAKKTGAKPSQSNKTRVESVDNRLINSEKISDELKSKIQAAGTQSEVYSNEEAKEVADAYVAEHGVDGAVQIADEYLKGSVKMFVYGAAIDKISQDIDAAKTQEEKDALAEKGAEVADRMQKNAEEYGRFIQAIGTFYKNSPLIIAKREVNRLEKASQDAFNRMVNKKDKVEKTNQGLNYVKKKNVNTEALNKIKTPKSAKEKTTELTRLRDLWGSLKGKGQRQLSDYSAEQIDVLHRMAVIFYADGKQTFSSLFKTLREETGISKSDFNELINSKLPSDISADGMSIVDLANEVNKPLVERVSSDKVEKSDIEKILEAGNREKSGKSQNVPQKLYAIYAELNKDNKKAMYEDIKNNPDKTEAELLAEWSAELNNQEQQQVIDKYFPEKPTENKKERKAEHEKIIEAYNSGVVNNKAGDKFKELFFDKFGLPKANTEETLKFIDDISKKLAKAPEGSIMWRETYEDLLDYIANNAYQNAIKNGMDRLSAMWYANILSSPATHLRNLQYNAAQALVLNPLMILEKALLKGDFGQFSNINKGMIEGLKKGATETGRVFRTGRGTRFDGIMARSIADRKLKFFSPVGRALRGSDIFFSDTAYQLKVREFARAMVKEEHPNWNNEEVDAKVNELMGQTKERKEFASRQAEAELSKFYGDNKPKDYETIKKIREFEIIEQTMPENLKDKLEESKNWAKRTLLTNKPTGLFGVVSDLVSNLNKNLYVTRFIIPFINVPLNVAQGMIERSPLGLIKAASSNLLHEKVYRKFEYLNPDQKKELALKAINYTVGMAVLMMLNGDDDEDELVITGNNTGEYTDDQGIVRGGGLEPMSVYVGGKKVMSYKTSPFAAMLLPVGLMRDSKVYGESKDNFDAIVNSVINYLLFINDASAMQGLQGFLGAVADKKLDRAESAKKWFAKQSNALIPYSGAMKYITNTVNAAKGETDTRPIDMREYIFKDVPLIQSLVGMSTRKDHFGQPVKEKFDVPLLPVGHRGLAGEISDISPYYKLMYEKDYIDDLKYLSSRKFMVGGKEVEISKKELDELSARRGDIVKTALDSKNVFKSKLKSDSKRAELTTLEYLKTLDNETFKMRMDDLFDQAGELARIEKFGEQIGLTKSQIIEYEKALQKIKNPRKRKNEADAPKVRQNRKTLKDYKEKNLEIILESL